MANNIGTHLVAALEEIRESVMVLEALGDIGPEMQSFHSQQQFGNIVQWVTSRHSDAFDAFHTLMLQKVIPIVAHINDPVSS